MPITLVELWRICHESIKMQVESVENYLTFSIFGLTFEIHVLMNLIDVSMIISILGAH